ncbi:hypothetical protein QTP86_018896 [Hemibagrus guttatus]|nr:hypothetical protein QTP86_018896 [Hemibagrus guttatus]
MVTMDIIIIMGMVTMDIIIIMGMVTMEIIIIIMGMVIMGIIIIGMVTMDNIITNTDTMGMVLWLQNRPKSSSDPSTTMLGTIVPLTADLSQSNTTTLSTAAPQDCVLSPLLFTLLTHDCAALHSLILIIKFADDTIVVGLISKNDESVYSS